MHGEKKPFSCNICDKAFYLKNNMKQHFEMVHEGKKPFKCDICDKTFSLKSKMKQHIEAIHGKRNNLVEFIHTNKLNFRCCWLLESSILNNKSLN